MRVRIFVSTKSPLRVPLKIAFVTRTSEIFDSEAEVKNRRRHSCNYVEDDFWPTTTLTEIAAVRSKNEFLEVPLSFIESEAIVCRVDIDSITVGEITSQYFLGQGVLQLLLNGPF